MPTVILKASELQQAETAFEQSARALPHEPISTTLGYQSNSFDTRVLWLTTLGIWAYFDLPPKEKSEQEAKRFWNAFGIGRPSGMVAIVCEINPSREGINRRTKGVFVKTENGKTLVCHRGTVNIAGGMTAEFFRQNYGGTWIEVDEGSRPISLIKVAELGSPDFGESLKAFIFEVARIKSLAKGR